MVKSKNYKQLQAELDDRLQRLESGELGIDQALSCYKEALSILTQLEEYLQNAEITVRQLQAGLSSEANG